MTNKTMAHLSFALDAPEPFYIASAVSSGPKHPLSAEDPAASFAGSIGKGGHMYTLLPRDNVQLSLGFKKPKQESPEEEGGGGVGGLLVLVLVLLLCCWCWCWYCWVQ